LLLENIAICDGFADTVKVLCNELNIPCIIMANAGHAWNLVQMEDGKWYRLDMTNAAGYGPDAGPVYEM
jgi:transglutaminase/protease-like cytokinesis protein 3